MRHLLSQPQPLDFQISRFIRKVEELPTVVLAGELLDLIAGANDLLKKVDVSSITSHAEKLIEIKKSLENRLREQLPAEPVYMGPCSVELLYTRQQYQDKIEIPPDIEKIERRSEKALSLAKEVWDRLCEQQASQHTTPVLASAQVSEQTSCLHEIKPIRFMMPKSQTEIVCELGGRDQQEDSYQCCEITYYQKDRTSITAEYIAILDGHGGTAIVKFLQNELHQIICKNISFYFLTGAEEIQAIYQGIRRGFVEAAARLNTLFPDNKYAGAMANVTLTTTKGLRFNAQLGDCSAYVIQSNGKVVPLCYPHTTFNCDDAEFAEKQHLFQTLQKRTEGSTQHQFAQPLYELLRVAVFRRFSLVLDACQHTENGIPLVNFFPTITITTVEEGDCLVMMTDGVAAYAAIQEIKRQLGLQYSFTAAEQSPVSPEGKKARVDSGISDVSIMPNLSATLASVWDTRRQQAGQHKKFDNATLVVSRPVIKK